MNESELREKWDEDKPIYRAWGECVVNEITRKLLEKGKEPKVFFKIPFKYRLKDDDSLVDKAFYRPEKNYSEPYNEIEDKVGARIVVLLLDEIKEICDIVKSSETWDYDACKHFDDDKRNDPLLFTYQSVHFILKPKAEIEKNGITIPVTTKCELQIRTLLQHAHAELTHDAIYKAKRKIRPEVHRTVAKSMALIETTDDFFVEVTKYLNYGPLQEYGVLKVLDGLYFSFVDAHSHTQKSAIALWDEFEDVIDDKLTEKIRDMFANNKYAYLSEVIKRRYLENAFYHQSAVLFVYWMLKNRKARLLRDWPLRKNLLEALAVDIGVSIEEY